MKLYFATHNAHKLDEARAILGDAIDLQSLNALDIWGELPETGHTLRDNALQKARFLVRHYGVNCFADDTGLEVDALGGEPGVYSARYAGEPSNSERNRQKLLERLRGIDNRRAHFRTVVALIIDGKEMTFEGTVEGKIIDTERGESGFGYDRLFMPDGTNKTFAQMTADEKNAISHRARAMMQMKEYLQKIRN